MAANPRTDHELLEEIQALRIQLQETQELLNAIRHGEVDALVVNSPEGEQVFTLQGADHPYRLMVETMSEGAVTVDADGTIVYCNQSFAGMIGTLLERVIGTSMVEYLADDDVSAFVELMEASKHTHCKGEVNLKSQAGLVPVNISTSPLPVDQVQPVCFVVTDLTEHKRNEELVVSQMLGEALHKQSESARHQIAEMLEREQEARSEAERANRLKDEFLATVSHELRNPLSAILGWSNILRRLTDQEGRDHGLQVIERNARAQLKLIEDLLDVSSIVRGKLAFSFSEVDVVKVVDAAVEAAQPAVAAKQIQLRTQLGSIRGMVVGDAHRLQQVVGNLLSNAIKFTPTGGSVQVTFEVADQHAVITVSDSGEGISPEFLPYVFERFRQQDASTKRLQGGLGLGLAIVRHIVELHRGTVTAASEGAGQGSTFTVRLPLAGSADAATGVEYGHGQVSAHTENSKSSLKLDGVNILVVDDDTDALEFVKMLLTEQGAKVRTSVTTAKARTEIALKIPDILVCDIGLPNEDGYEFIRGLRSMPDSEIANVPAVALTAYARPEDRAKALTAGYQLHLTKPVDPTELLAAVSRLTPKR